MNQYDIEQVVKDIALLEVLREILFLDIEDLLAWATTINSDSTALPEIEPFSSLKAVNEYS